MKLWRGFWGGLDCLFLLFHTEKNFLASGTELCGRSSPSHSGNNSMRLNVISVAVLENRIQLQLFIKGQPFVLYKEM